MNCIKINEEKFSGIRWKQEKGTFYGEKAITRKPYGEFTVAFKICAQSGVTGVSIKNKEYPQLDWEQGCVSYGEAVERVAQRFEETEGLIKRLEARNAEIRKHCVGLMNEAIQEMQKCMLTLEEAGT